MTVIELGRPAHLTSAQVHIEVIACLGVRPISDSCAVTIASWWHGPTGHALTLAELSTAGQLDTDAVRAALDDLRATSTLDHHDDLYVQALGFWTRHKDADHAHT